MSKEEFQPLFKDNGEDNKVAKEYKSSSKIKHMSETMFKEIDAAKDLEGSKESMMSMFRKLEERRYNHMVIKSQNFDIYYISVVEKMEAIKKTNSKKAPLPLEMINVLKYLNTQLDKTQREKKKYENRLLKVSKTTKGS